MIGNEEKYEEINKVDCVRFFYSTSYIITYAVALLQAPSEQYEMVATVENAS